MAEGSQPAAAHSVSSVRLVADLGCDLGESPSWDANSDKLLSVDINGKTIFILDASGTSTARIQLKEKVGAVVPTNKPYVLVAALERDVVSIDYSSIESPSQTVLASTPADHGLPEDGLRFNDAKACPGGQLIAGRMHNRWREGHPGWLYVLEGGVGPLKQLSSKEVIKLPNGMAWDESKHLMYFADTGANTVYKHSTDSKGIPLDSQRTTAFKLPEDDSHGPPDGITIDSDGNIWVAMAESAHVACFSPTGEELHRVRLPVKRPTALTFGGKDLKTLFITTRMEGEDNSSEHAGGIFATEIAGVKGAAAAYPFIL